MLCTLLLNYIIRATALITWFCMKYLRLKRELRIK